MKKIIINILIWFFLFAMIFISMFKYNAFRIFSNTDILLITSTILLFSGMIWTSFIFTFIYSFILDSVFMNFLGINLTSYLLTLLFLFYMCKNMNVENLLTKIFIVLVSCLLKNAIYAIFIFLFYWNGKIYFIPARIVFDVFFTVALGTAILWTSDLVRLGVNRWQKTK